MVAPRAVLGDGNVVVPHVTQSTHVAELAGDSLRANEWVARDDTRLPLVLALLALKRGLVHLVVVAELADACR